jgi:sulfate permease, SulP family
LGAIESLLSAVVADGMTGRRHRSNCELVAQGVANIGSSFFGGFCVTGTIARTATNVRAGAHGPVAGMLHSLFLLLFMLIAAPLAAYIPLAALAGVLSVVAWNMIEKAAIVVLIRSGWSEVSVLGTTFFLTVFRDLTEAIVVGLALGSILFIHRMSEATKVVTHRVFVTRDNTDAPPRITTHEQWAAHTDVVIYRITGVLFFGVAVAVGAVLDRIDVSCRALIVDFTDVPFLDSTGANMIEGLAYKAKRQRTELWLTGASPNVAQALRTHGLAIPLVQFADTVDAALEIILVEI